MSKRYTERYIKEVIEDHVFLKAPELKEVYSLEHVIESSMVKRNGADYKADCALDINEQSILLVYMREVQKVKEIDFLQLSFSDIQGIHIKSRRFFYLITIQCKDGRNYVLETIKHSTSGLPNQKEHVKSFIAQAEAQNLHDMDHPVHKENIKSNRKMAASYVATLVIFLLAAIFISATAFPNNIVIMFVAIITSGIIHFIAFILGYLFLYTIKDRKFVKEFNAIMKEYKDDENAEQLLTKLTNMHSTPNRQDSKNTFYLTMSTALHENNRTEEALKCLDNIQTTIEKELEIIQEQRKVLKGFKK